MEFFASIQVLQEWLKRFLLSETTTKKKTNEYQETYESTKVDDINQTKPYSEHLRLYNNM
jgi:hypothetical protein